MQWFCYAYFCNAFACLCNNSNSACPPLYCFSVLLLTWQHVLRHKWVGVISESLEKHSLQQLHLKKGVGRVFEGELIFLEHSYTCTWKFADMYYWKALAIGWSSFHVMFIFKIPCSQCPCSCNNTNTHAMLCDTARHGNRRWSLVLGAFLNDNWLPLKLKASSVWTG